MSQGAGYGLFVLCDMFAYGWYSKEAQWTT
jgi:hypothetical protein